MLPIDTAPPAPTAPLLQGHRVLVTGGAGGLGLAFAQHLAGHGAHLVDQALPSRRALAGSGLMLPPRGSCQQS